MSTTSRKGTHPCAMARAMTVKSASSLPRISKMKPGSRTSTATKTTQGAAARTDLMKQESRRYPSPRLLDRRSCGGRDRGLSRPKRQSRQHDERRRDGSDLADHRVPPEASEGAIQGYQQRAVSDDRGPRAKGDGRADFDESTEHVAAARSHADHQVGPVVDGDPEGDGKDDEVEEVDLDIESRGGAGHEHDPRHERDENLRAHRDPAEHDHDQRADAYERARGREGSLVLDVAEQIGEDHVLTRGVVAKAVDWNVTHPFDEGYQVGPFLEPSARLRRYRGQTAHRAV